MASTGQQGSLFSRLEPDSAERGGGESPLLSFPLLSSPFLCVSAGTFLGVVVSLSIFVGSLTPHADSLNLSITISTLADDGTEGLKSRYSD